MDAFWLSTGVCLVGGPAWPMSGADLLCVPMLRHTIATTNMTPLQHNATQHLSRLYSIDAGGTAQSQTKSGTAPPGGGWT